MAVFNPTVNPTQDPNYLNYSRVIDAPSPDMSGKIALETAGGALASGAAGIDLSLKTAITDKAYARVDKEREDYTQGLEMLKSNLDKQALPTPPKGLLDSNASMDDGSGVDEDNLPPGLDSGLSRVDRLAAAKAAGSPRLNDTRYSAEVLGIAKELRNEYGTGYREFIDQKVSQASGLPVANSYYQNMLQDINRQLNQQAKTKDDIGSLMMKNLDVPGMPAMIARRKAGDTAISDTMVLQKVGDWQNLQTQQKIDSAIRNETDDRDKNKVKNTESRMVSRLGNEVTFELSGVKDLGGVGTAPELLKYFDEVARGAITQSDAEVGQKKLMFNNWVTQVERKLAAGITGDAAVIGSEKAQAALKAAMFPIYTMRDFVNSKQDGPAFFHAQQVEALKKDATYNFLNNKDTQALSMQLMGAREVLGEQYFPDWIRSILGNSMDAKYKDMFNEEAMNAVKPITDARGQPIPRYIKDAFTHGKEVGAPGESEYYGSVTNLVSRIADDKLPQTGKDQLIDWAFNKKNVSVLDELKMDYYDKNGNLVPGKYRALDIMVAPKVSQAIAENAKAKPENYDKYKTWAERETARTYRQDFLTLNKMMAGQEVTVGPGGRPLSGAVDRNIPTTTTTVKDMGFSWNDKNNSFGLVDLQNRPITRENLSIRDPNYSAKLGTLEVLERVNKAAGNLAVVQKLDPKGPGDTSQYILRTLQSAGFRPGDQIYGATDGMMKAVIKSKQPDLTPQQLDEAILSSKRSNFAPEQRRGPSVSEFVSNPTNEPLPKRVPGQVVGPKENITGVDNFEIPPGMDPMDFIRQLKKQGKF